MAGVDVLCLWFVSVAFLCLERQSVNDCSGGSATSATSTTTDDTTATAGSATNGSADSDANDDTDDKRFKLAETNGFIERTEITAECFKGTLQLL